MLSLTHIHLRVQDPEDAAQWYVNMLEANIIERYQTSRETMFTYGESRVAHYSR